MFAPMQRPVAEPEAPAAGHPADEQLDRVIGPWALGANAVNLTVGAGIFALPAVVAAILGPAAIVAYLVCGLLIALVIGCFAEIGGRVTRSGGAVAYVDAAFGRFPGFLAWALFTVGFCIGADAAIANVLVDALAVGLPALATGWARLGVLVLLFGGLAAVNVASVRAGTRIAVGTTVIKLLPLVLLIVFGAHLVDLRALTWNGFPTADQLGAASLVLFFAFAGLESALTPSGEIRDPARTVPRGMGGAVVVLVVLYVALQLTTQGLLGPELASNADAPLAAAAERVAGGPGRALLVACTALAVFGTLAGDVLASPRALLAAAGSGALPTALGRVHPRFRTPAVAIICYSVLALVLAASGAFRQLAVLASMSLLIVYLAVALATLRFRRTEPFAPGAFRLPGGPVVPLLASATVLWLLAHSTRTESAAVALLLALASVWYVVARRIGAARARRMRTPALSAAPPAR